MVMKNNNDVKIFSIKCLKPVHIREYHLKDYCKENNIKMELTELNRVFKFSCKDEHQLDLLLFKFPIRLIRENGT